MLCILSCLSRRKIFPLSCNHLPSHKTGVSKGEEGCKFTSQSELSVAESWKRTAWKQQSIAGFQQSQLLWGRAWRSGALTTPSSSSSSSLPCWLQWMKERTTHRTGQLAESRNPSACTPASLPCCFAGVRCEGKARAGEEKGWDSPAQSRDIPAAAAGEGQPAGGQGAATGATGLLCANVTHSLFLLSRSNSQKLAGFQL